MDWFLKNEITGEEIQLLVGENTVGRHVSSNVRCPSIYSSRNHCLIEVEESSIDHIRIKDLKSSNGTFLNSHMIIPHRGVDVESGDIIGVGVNSEQEDNFFIFRVLKKEKPKPHNLTKNQSSPPAGDVPVLQQEGSSSSNIGDASLVTSSTDVQNGPPLSLENIKQEKKEKDVPNRKRKEHDESCDIASKIKKVNVKNEPSTSNDQSSAEAENVLELLKQKPEFLDKVKELLKKGDLGSTSHQNDEGTTHVPAPDSRKPSLDSTKHLSTVMEIDITDDDPSELILPAPGSESTNNNNDKSSSNKAIKSTKINETDITPNFKKNGLKRKTEKDFDEIESDKSKSKHQIVTPKTDLPAPKDVPGTSNGLISKSADIDLISVSSESGCESNDIRTTEPLNTGISVADAIATFNSINLLERPDDDYPFEDDDFEEEEEDSKNWFHQLSQTSLSQSQSQICDTEDQEAEKANSPAPLANDVYTYSIDNDEDLIKPFNRKPTVLSMLNADDSDVEVQTRASIALRTSRSTSSSGDSYSAKNENQNVVEIEDRNKLEEALITDSIVISSDSNDSDQFQEIVRKKPTKDLGAPKSNDVCRVDLMIGSEKDAEPKEPAPLVEKEKKPEEKDKSSMQETKGKTSAKKAELIEAYPMPPRKSHQRSLSKGSAEKLYSEQQSRQQPFSNKRSDSKKSDGPSSKSKKVEPSKDGNLIDKRKERLREISERDRLKKPQQDMPKVSASVKVKVSDRNRGSFLTEPSGTSLPSKTSKPTSSASIHPSSKSSLWAPSEPSTSKTQERSDSTIIRSGPRKRVSRVKTDDLPHAPVKASETGVPPASKAHTLGQLNSSPSHKDKSKIGRIPKIVKKKVKWAPEKDLVSLKFFELEEGATFKKVEGKDAELPKKKPLDSEDVITQDIITWRPSWLHEQKLAEQKIPPPVAKKYLMKKVATSFPNHLDYYLTMKPLMYHEVWASITQAYDRFFSHGPVDASFSQDNRSTFQFMIETLSVKDVDAPKKFLQITCNVILFEEDLRNCNFPRKDDLVILQLKLYDPNPPSKQPTPPPKSYFGLVSYDRRQKLTENLLWSLKPLFESKKSRANSLLTLKVLVDYGGFLKNKKVLTEHPLEMKKVKNLVPEMRLFDALRSLPSYSLSDAILSPESYDFSVPKFSTESVQKNLRDELNSSQLKAVDHAVKMCLSPKPNICMIQGAPGTGKSLVITRIIQALLKSEGFKNDSTILLCASSNAAVDELVVKLGALRHKLPAREKFTLVRVGRPENISAKATPYKLTELVKRSPPQDSSSDFDYLDMEIRTIEAKLTMSKQVKENLEERIKLFKPKAKNEHDLDAIKNYEEKIKKVIQERKVYEADLQRHESLRKNKNNGFNNQNYSTREDSEQRILKNAQVVAVTLSSCVTGQMKAVFMPNSQSSLKPQISVCIIDEATQCTEPEALIPLLLGVKSLVLVGDPNQLNPTVLSQTALDYGFGQSMFSRLYHSFVSDPSKYPLFFLDTQYRMHSDICSWPNKFFYKGRLKTDQSANRKCNSSPLLPYVVLSTNCKATEDGEKNEDEADIVVNLILEILERKDCKSMSIGVITPYQKQKKYFIDRFVKIGKIPKDIVEVNTIDSYQGSEKDIIIYSTVRTHGVGFLENQQRLNVSLTRAKSSLFICGNFVSLQDDPTWKELINNAKERRVFKKIFSSKERKCLKYVLKYNKN